MSKNRTLAIYIIIKNDVIMSKNRTLAIYSITISMN